jgi:hypothetical protein
MGFKGIAANILASLIIVLRRSVYLIFTPYKTMRRISLNHDSYQLGVLMGLAFTYFLAAHALRGSWIRGIVPFAVFTVQFFATALFFYAFFRSSKKDVGFGSFVHTIAYTLVPTLIWFYSNLVLYVLLPPPRTMSILGKGFSIFFIAYSLSLLVWKLILVYFSLRFSSRLGLYRIVYAFTLYIAIATPLAVLMYYFRIFRVPFI